jgi:undecaprenyl-diphosphatase
LDLSLYESINGFSARHDGFEDVMRFIAVDAEYLFVALLAILFLARGRWASQNARRGVVSAGFSAALALGIAQIISHIVERPRPFLAHPGDSHLFIPPSVDYSFPSDHATAAFAIATALILHSRRVGYLALGGAIALAVARVAVGTHYPADVIAGAALGSLCALVLNLPVVRTPLQRFADRIAWIYERTPSPTA